MEGQLPWTIHLFIYLSKVHLKEWVEFFLQLSKTKSSGDVGSLK